MVVLLLDVLKGMAAIVFAHWFYPWLYTLPSVTPPAAFDLQIWVPCAVCLSGLAALLGHSRSIWLKFAGGKSVATGLGVLLAMAWPVGLGALASAWLGAELRALTPEYASELKIVTLDPIWNLAVVVLAAVLGLAGAWWAVARELRQFSPSR